MSDLPQLLAPSDGPFDRAARGAAASPGVSGVFAAAYHGAICAAFGTDDARRTALCVTEDGGNTPRAIRTRFTAGRLHGTKSFVTFGDLSEDLLVLAVRAEGDDGHKDLVIARCRRDEVLVQETLHTPFMPDIGHARIVFEGSAAEVVVEDAWPHIKSFRLVEDLYVIAGTLMWFARVARDAGSGDAAATFAALFCAARELASRDTAAATTHLAFDGLYRLARAQIDGFGWVGVPAEVAAAWARDCAVLDVAATARAARAELARHALVEGSR